MRFQKQVLADPIDPWSECFDRYSGSLALFALQFTHSRADAEDVVQQAFVRLWRADRELPADPAPILFANVKRIGLDVQRSDQRRTNRERIAIEAKTTTEPVLSCTLELDEWRRVVESGLQQLPTAQREVLILRIWGELSFPQIAEALEISINTASSRYRYAIAKLRDLVQSDCAL